MPGVIFGFGWGSSLPIAMHNGRTDIAKQLRVTIDNRMAIYDSTESETSVEHFSVQKIDNLVLDNSKRVHLTISNSGYYYVLLYYPDDVPDTFSETEILEEITRREKTSLAVSTALSGVVPGTGQLMNRRYVKGSLMLAGAAALIGTFTFSLINFADDIQKAQAATSNAVRSYYVNSGEVYSTIALISGILYIGEALWSGLDNYSSQKN